MNARSFLVAGSIIVASLPALAAGSPEGTAVSTAQTFPKLTVIYVVPGVIDTGDAAHTGGATSFLCVNTDAVARQIRFVLRGGNGYAYAKETFNVAAQKNFTASTHDTNSFSEDTYLTPNISVGPATMYIFATSANIFCTAMIVDAAPFVPNGVALHMIRRNPAASSEE